MCDPREAQAEGIIFYQLPCELNYDCVDPLIRDIVKRVNESGWVFSGESCAGHPECSEDEPWGFNTKPMLRLICKVKNLSIMLYELVQASYYPLIDIGSRVSFGKSNTGLDIYPYKQSENWSEILVYIPAHNVYTRNLGLQAFARFAENINQPQ